jgi:hypothetical protein
MTKSEKGKLVRQRILDRLHYYGSMDLKALAIKVGEPRRAVAAHLAMMLSAGEVDKIRVHGLESGGSDWWVPLKWRTKVTVDGGAVRKVRRTVNKCGDQAPIKNQCADYKGTAPRQSTRGRAFGLL